MFDFPVWFDHIQMALWRVFAEVNLIMTDTIDENGEGDWFEYPEEIEVGTFLSRTMAQKYFESAKLFDFVSEDDLKNGKVSRVTVRFEMWYVDECNAAEQGKVIEEKKLY